MIDKLIELKNRTLNLRYKDKRELDDIQRKTKMYLEKLFPMKFTYPGEVDLISFYPSYYVSGMGESPYLDAWSNGQQALINLLDTRIEEAKIEQQTMQANQPKIQVVEKVVKVEDHSRINELNQEIKALRSSKKLWERINWTALITIIISLMGGSFFFGKYVGESKFDKEKIELFETNKTLTAKRDSLINDNNTKQQQIITLTSLIPKESVIQENYPLEVRISFISPTSIFDGEVFITAKEEFDSAILSFKGIKGLSTESDGMFDKLEIKVKKGDRFFFMDESQAVWTVNVVDSEVDVDLEILKRE